MGKVTHDSIGRVNKQLVSDLKAGRSHSGGYPIAEWKHAQSYNYDLSYGLSACGKKSLPGRYIGEKYYCSKDGNTFDMAKRIVHIYNLDDKAKTQKFYRLIHTSAKPGLNDNSYGHCDEITDIP